MKAEQRKELETNTLADKMGHAMQRVKSSQRRTFFIYLIVTLVVLGILWFGYRYLMDQRVETSMQWLRFYDGAGHEIDALATQEKDSFAGKAARMQIAWTFYWDDGVKMIAADQRGALLKLKTAAKIYGDLAEECKDDKVFEPQALLGRACAEESQAVQDREHLKTATKYYNEIVTKYKESPEGKFAQQRLEILEDKGKRGELASTYSDLQRLLFVPPRLQQQQLDDFQKNFLKKLEEEKKPGEEGP